MDTLKSILTPRNRSIEPECHLWGETFSPKMLHSIESIQIRGQNEIGEIMSRGRYKNQPVPYGSCQIIVPDFVDMKDSIFWMAEFIFMHKKRFEEAGATDIMLWIYWTGIQGNMSFTPKELVMISKANVPLAVDYIFEKINYDD